MTFDEQGRPEPPVAAGERETLVGFLNFQRATLEWKTRGLGPEGVAATTAASSMTLAGLLKHMAYVEDHWAIVWAAGEDRPEPWASVDWSADRDWEWNTAPTDPPDEVRTVWATSVERAQAAYDRAIDERGLGGLAKRSWPDGTAPSLRWILTHMIEEYARHNGHADLLREAVDGETGE